MERDAKDLGLEDTWTERATDKIRRRGVVVVALSSRARYGQ